LVILASDFSWGAADLVARLQPQDRARKRLRRGEDGADVAADFRIGEPGGFGAVTFAGAVDHRDDGQFSHRRPALRLAGDGAIHHPQRRLARRDVAHLRQDEVGHTAADAEIAAVGRKPRKEGLGGDEMGEHVVGEDIRQPSAIPFQHGAQRVAPVHADHHRVEAAVDRGGRGPQGSGGVFRRQVARHGGDAQRRL
jgi:hypothetical protein